MRKIVCLFSISLFILSSCGKHSYKIAKPATYDNKNKLNQTTGQRNKKVSERQKNGTISRSYLKKR